MMLRHMLAATTVLILCMLSAPAHAEEQASASPGGTWGWSYDYGQGEIKSSVTLHEKDNIVTGVFHGEDGEIDIKDGTFDGKTVAFHFDITRDGGTIKVSFTGVPSEDAIAGSLSAFVDGQAHDFPWNPTRATRPEDVIGLWNLTIKTDNGQTFEPQVNLEQTESKITGRYISKEIGEHDLESVTLTDNVLKFSASISRDGHTLKLNYEGKPRGNQLAGEIRYDIDGNSGASNFTGTLTPPKAE